MIKILLTMFLILHVFFFILACSDSDGENSNGEMRAVPIILEQNSEPEEWASSPVKIQRAFVDMDEVVIEVLYDRSMENHFSLVAYSAFFDTSPRSVHLLLAHEALGERYETGAEKVLRFQLDPLLDEYYEQYPEFKFNELALQLFDFSKEDENDRTLVYKFSGDPGCRYYATEYVVSGKMLEIGDDPYPKTVTVHCEFDDQALTFTCRSDFSLLNGETRFVEREWTYASVDDFIMEGQLIGYTRFLEMSFSGDGKRSIIPTFFPSNSTKNTYDSDGRLISTEYSIYHLEHTSWDFLGRPLTTLNRIMCDQEEVWTYNDVTGLVGHNFFTRSLHFPCIAQFERWAYDIDGNVLKYILGYGNPEGQDPWTTELHYEIKSVTPVCFSDISIEQ